MILIYKNINDYNELEYITFFNYLKDLEQNKINKLLNPDDKKRSLLGKKLLVQILKKHYHLDYNELEFYYNKNRKPLLKNKNIFFNISHSSQYSVCVVSNKQIGIDIEKIRKVDLNIINQFCTKKEKEYILLNNQCTNERIFEIYCLKEAYFKMLGNNLNNIKDVEFEIKNDVVISNIKKVNFYLKKDIENYILAVCERL